MAGTHDIARAAGMKDTEVKGLFGVILNEVKKGSRVLIKDFGTFELKNVKERTIKSPQIPGGEALVPEHDVIKFRPSPATKAMLNNGEPPTDGAVEAEPEAAPAPVAKPAPKAKVAAPAAAAPKAAPAAKVAAPAKAPAAAPAAKAPAKVAAAPAAKKAVPPKPAPVADEDDSQPGAEG